MENRKIHIVSLDVPFPPDYGGMMDVFYRIKSLNELGFDIILHSFTYGRGEPKELEKYCSEVHFYKRTKSVSSLFSKRPFIVETRKSTELLERLKSDNHPILLEGLHCCWFLEQLKNSGRLIFVRTHNIEHDYYKALGESSKGLKKIFFQSEAKKLRSYEATLRFASALLAIQNEDLDHFQKLNKSTYLLPASFPNLELVEEKEIQEYYLFHGNLSVQEVHDSALWLLQEVVPNLGKIQFKIAGKNPSQSLIEAAKSSSIELIINPNQQEMSELILKAKLHVLPTTQETGLKLKLLLALQCVGKTIVNSKQLAGNNLHEFCLVANSGEEFIAIIKEEFAKPIAFEERKIAIETFKKRMNIHDQLRNVLQKLDII